MDVLSREIPKEMSLFRKSDYYTKKQTTYSPKTKLPTKSKTKKHKCSQCQRKDATLYPVSEKEYRWLCLVCVKRFKAQLQTESKVNFIKASKLYNPMTSNGFEAGMEFYKTKEKAILDLMENKDGF